MNKKHFSLLVVIALFSTFLEHGAASAPEKRSASELIDSVDATLQDSAQRTIGADKKKVPLPCSSCNKLFFEKSDLARHIRTHTGERPYKCDICGKSFVQSGNLTVHSKIHTGEKPFACLLCSKAFARKNLLKVHMGSHSDVRSFFCTNKGCGKAFKMKKNLLQHAKIHNPVRIFKGELFPCSICKRVFTVKRNCRRHENNCLKKHQKMADQADNVLLQVPVEGHIFEAEEKEQEPMCEDLFDNKFPEDLRSLSDDEELKDPLVHLLQNIVDQEDTLKTDEDLFEGLSFLDSDEYKEVLEGDELLDASLPLNAEITVQELLDSL